MLYYPAGTTHRDHFYTEGERRFMTVSLTSEINRKLSQEINFIDYSTDFNCGNLVARKKNLQGTSNA
jgi:hypothetical protein